MYEVDDSAYTLHLENVKLPPPRSKKGQWNKGGVAWNRGKTWNEMFDKETQERLREHLRSICHNGCAGKGHPHPKPVIQMDEYGNRLTQNTESNGRFHTDWLNMIYPRLKIARDLLTDDGVIFISIDDNEVDDIFKVCNEVFGKERFLACFPRVTKRAGKTTEAIAKNHDYILVYCKTESPKIYLLNHTDEGFKYTDEYENERGKYKLNQTLDYDSLQYSPSLDYPIEIDGETFYPGGSFEKYQTYFVLEIACFDAFVLGFDYFENLEYHS